MHIELNHKKTPCGGHPGLEQADRALFLSLEVRWVEEDTRFFVVKIGRAMLCRLLKAYIYVYNIYATQ